MVSHIFHIADLHIRSGNSDQSRYKEFQLVFDRFIEDVSRHPAVKDNKAIVVVAGDLFHHKLKIESPGLKLIIDFFSNLGKLCKVFVIRGNHDFRQDKPNEPDLIESLLHLDNIYYMNKTGTFVFGDIGFGLLSIQDALAKGATSGLPEILPDFPEPVFDANVKYKIGLFHGSVYNFGNNWLPKGYDLFLFGDLHNQHVHGYKSLSHHASFDPPYSCNIGKFNFEFNNEVYGYSGSLIQQDFGESLIGHGYLLWNLEDKTIDCYHVQNEYGYVTIRLDAGKDTWDIVVKKNNQWQPLSAIVYQPWFPKNISLRVLQTKTSIPISNLLRRAKEDFNNLGINIVYIAPMIINDENDSKEIQTTNPILDKTCDLISFNTPETWIEYVDDKVEDNTTKEWHTWFKQPETLQIPLLEYNCNVVDKINDRNQKMTKKINEFYDNKGLRKITKSKFEITLMAWDWILCFRDNNWFDFNDIKKSKISVVSAKNGVGKTSLLETICIALYGEGFPSRTCKMFTSSIICQDKPKNSKAQTSIILKFDNSLYRIKRAFTTMNTDCAKLSTISKETTVDRINPNNEIENLFSGKTSVDNWVDLHIGNIKSFLMSCMITQHCDYDFFNMKSTDQKEMLDMALDIESCTIFQNILKESKLAHNNIIDLCDSIINSKQLEVKSLESRDDIDRNIKEQENTILILKEEVQEIQKYIPRLFKPSNNKTIDFDDNIYIKLHEYETNASVLKSKIYNYLKLDQWDDVIVSKLLSNVKEYSHSDLFFNKSKSEIDTEIQILRKQGILPKQKYVDLINDNNPSNFEDNIIINNKPKEYNEIVKEYGEDVSLEIFESKLKSHLDQKIIEPNMSYEYATKILSGSKPNKVNIDNGTNTEVLYSRLSDLTQELFSHVQSPPNRNETVITLDTQVIKQCIDECSEKNIQKLEKILFTIERLKNKYDETVMSMKDVENSLNEKCDVPYNEHCWACNKQPWIVKNVKMKEKMNKINDDIINIENQISKYSKPCDFEDYIEKLRKHINKLNQLEAFVWKDHLLKSEALSTSIKETEAKINWIKWNEAKQAIITWNNISDWNENKTKLEKYTQIISDVKESIVQEKYLAGKLFILEKDLEILNNTEKEKALVWFTELDQIITETNKIFNCIYQKTLAISNNIQITEKILLSEKIKLDSILENERRISELEYLEKYLLEINNRYRTIDEIYLIFSGFKEWLYTSKVIPYLTDFANNIIKTVCENRPLQLIGKMMSGNPLWFVHDNNIQPIEKASGYQKFLLGLAIRIALSKFGTTGILCTQLFIDEGFTNCDSENIAKIPKFIDQLSKLYQNGVLLVSHLDDIKMCAKTNVVLVRDLLETTTQCQYGNNDFSKLVSFSK